MQIEPLTLYMYFQFSFYFLRHIGSNKKFIVLTLWECGILIGLRVSADNSGHALWALNSDQSVFPSVRPSFCQSVRLRSLVYGKSSLPFIQSGSYCTCKVTFGEWCAVTLNKVSLGLRLRSWQIFFLIFSPLSSIWTKLQSQCDLE